MHGDGDSPRRVSGIDQNMMAADDPVDGKSRVCERLDDALAADDRQLVAAHT